MKTWLVTGGAGFIGANFILQHRSNNVALIVNLDKLTYAGNLFSLASVKDDPHHIFIQGDIGDKSLISNILQQYQPDAIIHFAAETHVDRSIYGPEAFIETNVLGTLRLLEGARDYWDGLKGEAKKNFRFLHISTDEVFGSLGPHDPAFNENTPYSPNSPYAASKAASDHLVRAYYKTYQLPTLITNCSNNYGPIQFPEKLIPLMILNALRGNALPIYGDGKNVRDWLYVADHCEAVRLVLEQGRVGESYNIGGQCEKTNLEVVNSLCAILDDLCPTSQYLPHNSLITFVADRPGHDRRYSVDTSKISEELGWSPKESFQSGLTKTVRWYLANPHWVESVTSGAYRQWIQQCYEKT